MTIKELKQQDQEEKEAFNAMQVAQAAADVELKNQCDKLTKECEDLKKEKGEHEVLAILEIKK